MKIAATPVVVLCALAAGCLRPPPLPECGIEGELASASGEAVEYLDPAPPAPALGASPEHASVFPPPPQGPRITLEYRPGDLVSEPLRRAAARVGWTVLWDYPHDIVVETPLTLRGTVRQVAHDLARVLHASGKSIGVVAHPNKTLRVVYRK